jgi:TolB-like protein/DNA-binding winged helix-turn-helix (wHTH) protein
MRTDFRLGDWIVRPRHGYVERGDEIVRIHPKPMAVLEFLASAGGEAVTRDELFEAVWPGVIVSDDALAQCIVELRKSFNDPARDAKIIGTIPKVGYALIPPVTALGEEEPASGNNWLRLVVIGIVAVAVVMIAMYRFVTVEENLMPPVTEIKDRASIAVLPFINRSMQAEDEFFSDGMHDELLSRLALVPGLKVISRTSVNRYRQTDKSLPEIANELSVSTILEGSVQRAGDQVRINVQLIDAHSDTHLWSQTYDSDRVDSLVVQDEISASIVAALKAHLGVEIETRPQRASTTNIEAHDAFLRGRYLIKDRVASGVEGALREFERAVMLDPDYAIAHAELAITSILAGTPFFQLVPWNEAISTAELHASRAITLNPGLAEAHAAIGRLAWMKGAFEDAMTAFEQALLINPNYSDVYSWMALLSARVGRYVDILPYQERALRLDPVSLVPMNNYVHSLIEMGHVDEADRELEKIRTISPRIYADYHGRVKAAGGEWAYLALGSLDELLLIPGDLRAKGELSGKFAMLGLEQEALSVVDTPNAGLLRFLNMPLEAIAAAEVQLANARPNIAFAQVSLGMAYAAAGNYAKARPLLEEAWQQNGKYITLGLFNSGNAVALLAIRRDSGDEAGAAELQFAIKDDISRLREAGFATSYYLSVDFAEGVMAYLSGEREQGLSLIARASEYAYFIGPKTAYLEELYEDPEFVSILARQAIRQSRERHRFLTIVCNENPYQAVWQPSAETCEQFAMEGGEVG